MQRIKSLREKARRWLVSFWTEYKWCILSGMIVGLIAYMFTFTNKLSNHDDVLYMFGKGVTVTSGRWGLELLRCILPDFSMPWIYGLITLMCISASAGLTAYAFRIRGKLPQALLGGLFVAFPSLIGTFAYMFTSSAYGVAFLLATLAFVLAAREHNPVKNTMLGTLLMILSLSIYQAYISLTVSLLVIYLIQKLVKTDAPAKEIVLTGVRYICFALAAMVLYYGITKLILAALSLDMNEYAQGALSVASNDSISMRILRVFTAPYFILVKALHGLTRSRFAKYCHALCLLLTGIQLLRWLLSSKSKKRRWLLPLLLLSLLLSLNMLYFITTPEDIHTLVLYGYVSMYVLFIALACPANELANASKRLSELIKRAIYALLILIMVHNVYLANEASLLQFVNFQSECAELSGIITRVESMPEYQPGVKLAMIGKEYASRPDVSHYFISAKSIKGVAENYFSREQLMHLYLGFNGEFASAEEIMKLQETPEFSEMQIYPYYDSIRAIDGYIVVKF